MPTDWLSRRQAIAVTGAAAAIGIAAARTGWAQQAAGSEHTAVGGDTPITVGFLLDERATVIDFAGPWEVLQDAMVAGVPGFELFTVAPTERVLRATGGLQIKPDYTLANAPPARVLIIPAQAGGRDFSAGGEKVAWIRARYPQTDVIMSVCTGAFLLARTGLLDGLKATTHHDFVDDFRAAFPKVQTVPTTRFVDNGRLVTAGGLSSGITAALHLVERYYGRSASQAVATYMEYGSSADNG